MPRFFTAGVYAPPFVQPFKLLEKHALFTACMLLLGRMATALPAEGLPQSLLCSKSLAAQPSADLALEIESDKDAPKVGETLTITLTLRNEGPAATSGVQVSALVPAGFDYLSDDAGGAYVPATGIWSPGIMEGGGTAILHISISPKPEGDYDIKAQVSASELPDPDSTPGNGDEDEDDFARIKPQMRQD